MGKIKILLVLTVVCSLMFGNVAMATEATTSGSSLVETVTNLPEGFPAFPTEYNGNKFTNYALHLQSYNDGDRYKLHCFYEEPVCYLEVSSGLEYYRVECKKKFVIYHVYKNSVENGTAKTWEFYGEYDLNLTMPYVGEYACSYIDFPVYADSTLSEVVFPPAPAMSQTVAGLMPEQMAGMTMSEILTLIPIVLSVILLYLGLRKGLSFLWTLLRQA